MKRAGRLNLRGKRIIVLGLGIHGGGLGVTRFLVEQGADVTVTDLKSAEQLAPSLEALRGLPVRYILGEHRLEDLAGADMLVRTALVLAVAVMINYIGAQFFQRFYLSSQTRVRLSSRTVSVLHSLTNRVAVTLY